MKVLLAGPTLTSSLRRRLGVDLARAPPGTAATPIANLAAGLVALGHSVHVVTTDPTIDAVVNVTEGAVSVSYCPLRGAPRYAARWRMLDLFEREIRSLAAVMSSSRPDIIHAHWTYEFAEAALRAGGPHLVTMADLGWDNLWHFRDTYRVVRLVMKHRTMPRVKHLSVVAPFMQGKARHYGYFGPVDLVPNGVAVPPRTRHQTRRKT